MKITAIIPARYQSSRFPGKPLVDIEGKPMIQHVYERVSLAKVVNRVIVATDDERIFRAVQAFGGEGVLTSPSHQTGTDRIAEVARNLDSEIIVNVQGDEPLVSPEMVDRATDPLVENRSIVMGTLKKSITHIRELFDPHVVKVVTDEEGYALYFSRSPIPFSRDAWENIFRDEISLKNLSLPERCYKHIGLYAYRRDFLLTFATLSPTPLEHIEKLEQLRALEHGYRIKVVETDQETVGVDTPEDVERVIAYLKNLKTS